jgi:RNA polymerase primary sigma factor
MARMPQLKITKQFANRDDPALERYLNEIGKVKLLKAEKEVEFAMRIKQGDDNAFEELCKANLRFVVSVAKQYRGQGMTLADLISCGNIGLIKAVERFDHTRGFKFISYAVWWIRQQILQSLAEEARVVRLPLNKIGSINRINKAFAKLEQEYGRAPSALEIAKLLQMTLEEVKTSLSNSGRHVSMDAPLREGEDSGTMHDFMRNTDFPDPEEALMTDSLRMEIERSLDALSIRQADVIRLYFGLRGNQPHTLEEIGQKFGVTRERVRQIKEKAIYHMKHGGRGQVLRAYLG